MRLTPNQRRVLEVVATSDAPMHQGDIADACEDYENAPWTYRAAYALADKGLLEPIDPTNPVTYVATEAGREVVREDVRAHE